MPEPGLGTMYARCIHVSTVEQMIVVTELLPLILVFEVFRLAIINLLMENTRLLLSSSC